jgi:hypothetical protein
MATSDEILAAELPWPVPFILVSRLFAVVVKVVVVVVVVVVVAVAVVVVVVLRLRGLGGEDLGDEALGGKSRKDDLWLLLLLLV